MLQNMGEPPNNSESNRYDLSCKDVLFQTMTTTELAGYTEYQSWKSDGYFLRGELNNGGMAIYGNFGTYYGEFKGGRK